MVYKIISKIIANRLKPILSGFISEVEFGFLCNRKIHDAVGAAQEGMNYMKLRKTLAMVLKIYLAEVDNKVSWLYLKLTNANWNESTSSKLDYGMSPFRLFCSPYK